MGLHSKLKATGCNLRAVSLCHPQAYLARRVDIVTHVFTTKRDLGISPLSLQALRELYNSCSVLILFLYVLQPKQQGLAIWFQLTSYTAAVAFMVCGDLGLLGQQPTESQPNPTLGQLVA